MRTIAKLRNIFKHKRIKRITGRSNWKVLDLMLIVHIFKNPLIRECSSLPHTLFEDTLFKTSEDIVYPCRRHLVYITTLKMTVTKSVKTQHIGIFLIIHNNSQVHALASFSFVCQ